MQPAPQNSSQSLRLIEYSSPKASLGLSHVLKGYQRAELVDSIDLVTPSTSGTANSIHLSVALSRKTPPLLPLLRTCIGKHVHYSTTQDGLLFLFCLGKASSAITDVDLKTEMYPVPDFRSSSISNSVITT